MFTRLIVVAALAMTTLGCNYNKIKQPEGDVELQFSLPAEKLTELSYALIKQKVFTPKCVTCHGDSGRVNLESYNEVLRNLDGIRKTVFVTRTMPKRGGLTQEQLSYLWNWIKLGAPENAQSGQTPPPTEETIQATFESLDKNVFQTSCKDCHNPTGTGKRIPLDKQSLLDSPLELILPGNPDESGLMLAIERTDNKRMPPAEDGYSALSSEAIEAIRTWIQNGAKD